jgi:hypothetical protein
MRPVRFHSRPAVRRPSPPERHAACVALIKPAGYENDPWGGHISGGKTSDAIDQERLASKEALFSSILIVQTVPG